MAEIAFQRTETGMNVLTRFLSKFRPDYETHRILRQQAEETLTAANSMRDKRERFERDFPEREFPVAGLIERRGAIRNEWN